ncbi:unnamed protein product [Periconia digitata]|uniref:Uncharacterized protein n=1 Tax=Periconia digitata TaxID=1303443 RepID=A0A9W4U4V4_9PLEO|nr:unnamed protein product [Periconia digitata]
MHPTFKELSCPICPARSTRISLYPTFMPLHTYMLHTHRVTISSRSTATQTLGIVVVATRKHHTVATQPVPPPPFFLLL